MNNLTDDKLQKILLSVKSDSSNKLPSSKDTQKRDKDHRKKELENNSLETNIALKKGICSWVKVVVSIYLFFVASILLSITVGGYYLSDNVAIALLTTTTINILGLPYIIIKSLFPRK